MSKAVNVLRSLSSAGGISEAAVTIDAVPAKIAIAKTKDGAIAIKPMDSSSLYFLSRKNAAKMAAELTKLTK